VPFGFAKSTYERLSQHVKVELEGYPEVDHEVVMEEFGALHEWIMAILQQQ
jgi:hypothetical protein